MSFIKMLRISLFIAALTSFLLLLVEFLPADNIFKKLDFKTNKHILLEEYDPSLSRLNTIEKLEDYCDSIYYSKKLNVDKSVSNDIYPGIVVKVIKQKFYHGYSHFGISDNYLAKFLEPLFINKPVSAIVDPDDMVKYPMAACSQQSILLTKLLMKKGYNVRKVGFYHPQVGGHYALEVFYNGSWHYYDPNKEMDFAYLQTLKRPSVEFLAKNPNVLVKAYQYKESEAMLKLLPTYFYGKPNKIDGLNALIYQKTTKFLSYTIWIFFFFLYIVVRKKEAKMAQPEDGKITLNSSLLKLFQKTKRA